jgi:hypothetical protein
LSFTRINYSIFLVISLFFGLSSYGQNAVHFSFHQDLKLLAFGDELGNRAGTLNFIGRVKYEASENNIGYMMYGLEYEKALLATQYSRFGAFSGFTFMDVFNNFNFHLTPSGGIGVINREGKNLFSLSASLQLEYFISNRIRLSVLNQITQRTDLKYLYDDLKYRYSLFVGIEIRLFQLNNN